MSLWALLPMKAAQTKRLLTWSQNVGEQMRTKMRHKPCRYVFSLSSHRMFTFCDSQIVNHDLIVSYNYDRSHSECAFRRIIHQRLSFSSHGQLIVHVQVLNVYYTLSTLQILNNNLLPFDKRNNCEFEGSSKFPTTIATSSF